MWGREHLDYHLSITGSNHFTVKLKRTETPDASLYFTFILATDFPQHLPLHKYKILSLGRGLYSEVEMIIIYDYIDYV